MDDPVLLLADDATGMDRPSGWAEEADADARAELEDGPVGTRVSG
ncbi:hypothetical protein ACLF6K_38690 (plasmid) [Streptomyces xanthophaeus]